jgi:prepilin-type N-terminal cleavage/methylation domain-containing protein
VFVRGLNFSVIPAGERGYFRRNDEKTFNNKGVTLIELIVVVSVIVILIMALVFSFEGWIGKYRVESQVKEMYSDFMYARTRAMERGRTHFITGTATAYTMYEDTNTAPDGNGTLESATDAMLPTFPKSVTYQINWTGTGAQIDFNKNGTIGQPGSIFLTTTNDADYDCLNISAIKVHMGKRNGANCEAK